MAYAEPSCDPLKVKPPQPRGARNLDKDFKAIQMGHFVMVSLWCASLSTNTISLSLF